MLLVGSLAACGEENEEPASADLSGLEAVTIAGEAGSAPEVTWKGQMDAGDVETETLQEGDGEAVEEGDQVLTHIWIGNGFTEEQSFSTYDEDRPELVTLSAEVAPLFGDAFEGQNIGARVAVTASAEEAFGPTGNSQLNIANKDSVLVIVDLVSAVLDGPEGEDQEAPAWVPEIVVEDDVPTALKFAGTPKPTDELRKATLIQGSGAPIEKGQLAVVDYLGQVYAKPKPFDESFSAEPASFGIGTKPRQVIAGWDKALVGVEVGSRVMLAIPPELGYGKEGNEQAGIKGTDTLYFVIDVLAAG